MRHFLIIFLCSIYLAGCSSAPYKKQAYAKLQNTKVFEEEYDVVWKAVTVSLADYLIEYNLPTEGRIQTDWIYSTSNEKYMEYKVNGFPRKRYLQTRYKYKVLAKKQLGGVEVTVDLTEEFERLKSDGSFDSWKSSTDLDSSRQNDLLKIIELNLHSLPKIAHSYRYMASCNFS